MGDPSWLLAIQAECDAAALAAEHTAVAEAVRSPSDDEDDFLVKDPLKMWYWLPLLREHLSRRKQMKQSSRIKLLSSCTGSFGEAEVLEVSSLHWLSMNCDGCLLVLDFRALVCIFICQCSGTPQALEIPFVPVGAANTNDRFRAYVQCTVHEPVRHFHASMEDQVSGVCCTLHGGQDGCAVEAAGVVDIAVAGSPCPPFSMQRSKRFLDGTVEQHPLFYVTDDILPKWLVRFEPKFAVLEQVQEIGMFGGGWADPREAWLYVLSSSKQDEDAAVYAVQQRVSKYRLVPGTGGNAHQLCLSKLDAWSASERQPSAADGIYSQLLNPSKTMNMSFSALRDCTGQSRQTVTRSVERTAAALQIASDLAWGSLLSGVAETLGTSANVRGKLFLTHCRYDETPSRIRVDNEGNVVNSAAPGLADLSSTVESCVAKVFQIEFGLTMVFQRLDNNAVCVLTGSMSRMLAVAETTSAANIQKVLESRCDLPHLQKAARHFPWRVRCVCTDRYAANFAAEEKMQAKARLQHVPYTRDHTACEMHMVATAQSRTFSLPELDVLVKGLIACGLTMIGSRAKHKLRNCLFEVFEDKLNVLPGDAPGGSIAEFREALYEHFLPLFPGAVLPNVCGLP
eukprot:s6826_g1.t1